MRESERRFLPQEPSDRVVLPSSRLDSTRTVSSARAVQIRGGIAVEIEWETQFDSVQHKHSGCDHFLILSSCLVVPDSTKTKNVK